MRLLVIPLIVFFSVLQTLFTYLRRLSSERGRFLVRGSRDNIQFYEEQIEPRLGITAELSAWTFPFLVQANLIVIGFLVAAWNLGRPFEWPTLIGEAGFLILDVMAFGEVIPNILLTRTEGRWLLRVVGPLRIAVRAAFPLVAVSQFLHHVATLGGPSEEEMEEATPAENIEALIEVGEQEGLLEKEDRKLIQSVMEFGDKTVREVMTPRQKIVAVPVNSTLSQLRQLLGAKRFTRIPAFDVDLDHIAGFVHAGDLFTVEESEMEDRTVREFLRPVTFVPETKPIAELLEELKQKAQVAIVVDEYGAVAGLATIEDLVEEIVGDIRDEHEVPDVIPRGEGRYTVPGGLDLGSLRDLFDVHLENSGESTTVSGLVTDALGRVPSAGEKVERDGLTFHVLESDGRRVIRLLVAGPPKSVPVPDDAADSGRGAGSPRPS